MKSKSKIEQQLRRKTSSELVQTILAAKKNEDWQKIAGMLSTSTRNMGVINLDQIDKGSKEGDTILVPGKVLGNGDISKKIRIIAFKFSEEAEKKLKNKKCETRTIIEEIKLNPKAEGVKIL